MNSMLGHRRAFERVMAEEAVMLHITPLLFFHVLLRQARKDLQQETYTIELRSRQKIPVFDSHQVVELLDDAAMRSYLADMLASFTRVHSFTWPVRVKRGIWYKHRFSDLDVDSLIRMSGLKAAAVSSMLIALEMKKVVRMLPGRRVARCGA